MKHFLKAIIPPCKTLFFFFDPSSNLGFTDFLDFIDEEHALAEMYFKAMGGGGTMGGGAKPDIVGAKIAATLATGSGRPSVGNTAPAAGRCAMCNAAHALTDCSSCRDADAEAKKRACSAARACFRCLETGHIARNCRTEIRCASCQQPHHSWAHAIQPSCDGGARNDAGGGGA